MVARPLRLASALALALAPLAPGGLARAGEPPAGEPGVPALARLDPLLTAEQRALARFVEHLGWRYVDVPEASHVTLEYAALPTIDSPGDLRVNVPERVTPESAAAFGNTLPALADSIAARLAWLRLQVPAVREATRKLAANAERGRYVFPKILFIDNLFFSLGPPEPEWAHDGPLWRAQGSASKAVEAFYEREASAECYAAQLLATYAIQYELYGPERFDEAFKPEDLALGPPAAYHQSRFGRAVAPDHKPAWKALLIGLEEQSRDPFVVLARYGPLAFVGLTGIVRDQDGGVDANENFVVVSISQEAVDALRTGGGFSLVSRMAREVREHYIESRRPLLTPTALRERRAAIERIFSHPLFRDMRLYIHPYGVIPLAEIVRKKFVKQEAAVEAILYLHGREDAFFRAYREAYVRRLSGS